jgi:hypothetical protein
MDTIVYPEQAGVRIMCCATGGICYHRAHD